MEREVIRQNHTILQMSIECREKRAHCQLVSTASSPLNLKELTDSAPLVISYALHALVYFIVLLYAIKKNAKVKKPNQNNLPL